MSASSPNMILSLPYELRLVLYSLLFPENPILAYDYPRLSTLPRPHARALQRLSETCHALQTEAVTFFYSHVTLKFVSARHMATRLTNMGSSERRHVMRVKLDFPSYVSSSDSEVSRGFKLLAESQNLVQLWIGVHEKSTSRLWRLKKPHLKAMLPGLEQVRVAEGEDMDFRVREVGGLVGFAGQTLVEYLGASFETDVVDGMQSWGKMTRFRKGVIMGFEKEMGDIISRREDVDEGDMCIAT